MKKVFHYNFVCRACGLRFALFKLDKIEHSKNKNLDDLTAKMEEMLKKKGPTPSTIIHNCGRGWEDGGVAGVADFVGICEAVVCDDSEAFGDGVIFQNECLK